MSEEQQYRMRLSSRDTPYHSSTTINTTEVASLAASLKEAASKSFSSSPTRSHHRRRFSDEQNRERKSPNSQSRNQTATHSQRPRSPQHRNQKPTNDTTDNKNGVRAWQRSAESAGGHGNIKSDKRISSTSPKHRRGNSNARIDKNTTPRNSSPRPSSRVNGSGTQSHNNHQPRQQQKQTPTARGTRITAEHILFWGGPLSNWNVGSPFSGRRAMDLLISRLEEAGIKQHPSRTALTTELMARHDFVCGEQFMMACKGWLFERMIPGAELDTSSMHDTQIQRLCNKILHLKDNTQRQAQADATAASENQQADIQIDYEALHNGTMASCINAPSPRDQKAIGRRARGFNEALWTKASTHVVVAGSIARAEVDSELRALYNGASRNRKFVEGSPVDRTWGIGLKWDDPRACDEKNWKGENRLGKCHDLAAKYIRDGEKWR
ncbi:hypothetical protein LTR10_019303 [Elasticomyces elasticus]|uniref:NADAR domain-containing protein n=1 Tax=Exophiala sideris TaxID=1016849 RepID=A0ABR0IYG7_9EURO|nr:hypothetical protein LTR10_019303 [Elasticomyces elasticus]KAK5021981.1 hypothetical protein LTS07_010563 [Exophiala sideris]KAK5026044.1 hypothetical protein LTR13_010201 [Exophiala sideris]KAK5050731.1 hypothetical protein LTR69_010587 [Exophiala sideris]KAK5177216.1 hypothetical protein LTR44_010344 [Eurotiomycetes sp. CCFEE 6388]